LKAAAPSDSLDRAESCRPESKQNSIQIRTSHSARSTRLEEIQKEDRAGPMTLFTITQTDEPGATDNPDPATGTLRSPKLSNAPSRVSELCRSSSTYEAVAQGVVEKLSVENTKAMRITRSEPRARSIQVGRTILRTTTPSSPKPHSPKAQGCIFDLKASAPSDSPDRADFRT
jgi:hypothetical protein